MTQSDTWTLFFLGLSALASPLVGIAAMLSWWQSWRNGKRSEIIEAKVDMTHKLVNSEMAAFRLTLREEARLAVAQGVKDGITEYILAQKPTDPKT